MAKKQTVVKSMEEALWEACNKLRGSIEPSEYKHVVLSLIFLKYAGDHFEKRRQEIIDEYHNEAFLDMVDFYAAKNVFYLAPESRWSFIMQNAKQPNIAILIDTALTLVEKHNKPLRGALPNNYYSSLGIDMTKLASLLDEINKIDTLKDEANDLIGRVYEYFLSKFAIAEGKGKGEFYTPKSIVNLIAELIQPYEGKIYDPCCGSGGMFVQSLKFVDAHHGNRKNVSVYGQEYTKTTYKLAKMNLAIRGISANLGEHEADTFHNDQHKDLKADFIMANPPFNQSAWREDNQLTDNPTVCPDDDLIISAGNFHGEPIAMPMDFLCIAMAELGNISERRTYKLVSGTRDLPSFLVAQPGVNSGFMIPQYTAAAIASQSKTLCMPSSADTIPTSQGQEDHVSMGANAGVKLCKVVENTERVLAIELFNAAQALEFRRPLKSSPVLEHVFADYRKVVPFINEDQPMYPHIAKSVEFLQNNKID